MMKMVERNQRKVEVLEVIEQVGNITASQLAEVLGISHTNASALLLRYWKYGLLNRYTVPNHNMKVYSIKERGRERLVYLQQAEEKFVEDEEEKDEHDEVDKFLDPYKEVDEFLN